MAMTAQDIIKKIKEKSVDISSQVSIVRDTPSSLTTQYLLDRIRAKTWGKKIDQITDTSFKFLKSEHSEILDWLTERNIEIDDSKYIIIVSLSIELAVEFKLRFFNNDSD